MKDTLAIEFNVLRTIKRVTWRNKMRDAGGDLRNCEGSPVGSHKSCRIDARSRNLNHVAQGFCVLHKSQSGTTAHRTKTRQSAMGKLEINSS
jgi:hypothetical protein